MPERLVAIDFAGPAPDWARLPGVEILEASNGHVRLRVARGGDLSALVSLVPPGTEVRSFSYEPPRLSELFRQAVAA